MLKAITVKDYMAHHLVCFTQEMDVLHAIHLLLEKRISGAPVTDGHGNVVGMLSERDCLRVALNAGYHGEWGGRVAEFMSTDVQCVDADMSIVEMAKRFLDSPYRRFPVVSENRLVGQISRRDVLKALQALRD